MSPEAVRFSKSIRSDVLKAARRVFGPDWASDHAAKHDVLLCLDGYVRDMQDLRNGRFRSKRWLRGKAHQIFKSRSARFCGIILAAAKKRVVLTPIQAMMMAQALNFFSPPGEPVKAKLHQKSSGEVRIIVIAGVRRTAYQRVCRDVISAICTTPATEYATRGKGRDAAVLDTIDQINAGEGSYVLVADVKDFFGSITREGLGEIIPLPSSILSNCLFIEEGVEITIYPKSLALLSRLRTH